MAAGFLFGFPPGLLFQGGFRLPDLREAALPEGELLWQFVAPRGPIELVFFLVLALGVGQKALDLFAQVLFGATK